MPPTADGGPDAEADANVPEEFMCGGEGEGLQINFGAFEGTSCDQDLNGILHLKEVTSATGTAGDFLVRFDFYNCPERDNTCLCRLSVATQPGFEAVWSASSLKDHQDEDVTISLITSPIVDIQILGASPVRLTTLFVYKTGVTSDDSLPESQTIVFGGALVATLDGDPTDQTCVDGPLSGNVLHTKMEFRTDVGDANSVVRSTTFLQSGSIEGGGGDRFSLWTVDAVDDPEQSYVHRWIAVPQ